MDTPGNVRSNNILALVNLVLVITLCISMFRTTKVGSKELIAEPIQEMQPQREPEIFEVVSRMATIPDQQGSTRVALLRGGGRIETIPFYLVEKMDDKVRFVRVDWKIGSNEIAHVVPIYPGY